MRLDTYVILQVHVCIYTVLPLNCIGVLLYGFTVPMFVNWTR